MDHQILTMKLYAPPLRSGMVQRLRLLEKMNLGLQDSKLLTLITAPAGYGKTTLALEWLTSLDRPYSWLSLDRADNDPVRFLTYLIAALGEVDKKIGEALTSALDEQMEADEATRVQYVLMALVNQLQSHTSFALVLDDYHTITDLRVHQILEFILNHQPPQMHLIIVTRQDPLLPLSKLRSRGQLTEIRLGELRFTQEETDRFLNGSMELSLLPEEITALQVRTEGWIAGLQLVAFSLSELPAWSQSALDSEARSKYIRAFAGDDRHVADYLLDEVLSRQQEKIQRFLLFTSVLKRLCGPLCDAVLEDHGQSSQQILENLERSNLFIIPLDNRRQWYRYHYLFADLLNSRLQSFDPGLIPELHHRASLWFESAGLIDDAVEHALLAEDFERALGLVEQNAMTSVWTSGDLSELLHWFKRLPEEVLITRPRLCMYYARALFFAGEHLEAANRYLDEAENRLRTQISGSESDVWGLLLINRAAVAAMRGDSRKAIDLVNKARPTLQKTDFSSLVRLGQAEGMAYLSLGAVHEAEAAFRQAIVAGQQSRKRNVALDCVSGLSLTQALSGKLRQAIQTCQEVLVEHPENQGAPAACTVRFALAQALYMQNELSTSEALLTGDLGTDRGFGRPHILWQVYLLQARLCHARGDLPDALAALEQAAEAADRFRFVYASQIITACKARIDLAEGNLRAATDWAKEFRRIRAEEGGPASRQQDFEELTLASILLSEKKYSDSLDVLADTIEKASSPGRIASIIEARILKASALDALGDHQGGVDSMIKAIELAEPEGFVRIFLNQGKIVADLITCVRKERIPANVLSYTLKLLEAYDETGGIDSSLKAPSDLVEPLSERELEVLTLIADGLSNPEIAAHLYLSVNTLRAHTLHIYQKLNVHNRIQAVNRAQELGLLHPK